MNTKLEKKIRVLKNYLAQSGSAVVAFSAGIDSSFLLKMAIDSLGKDKVLAVTAISPTYTKDELKYAKKLANKLNANWISIHTNEFNISEFKENLINRCYFCKKELYQKLLAIAKEKKIDNVYEGSNYDDTKDFRPGMKAAKELKVVAPLLKFKFTKKDIRIASKNLDLPNYDLPSSSCLASRIPYGEKISIDKLQTIEKAEKYLKEKLKLSQVRVRLYSGTMARIESMAVDMNKIVESREKIIKKFNLLGIKYVTLDLEGYRTGSMNIKV